MDCGGNPPSDFQDTEKTSPQINNEIVEMGWQLNTESENTDVSLMQRKH
jgi:hypothetical protein